MKCQELEEYPNAWLHTVTHEDLMNNTFPVIIDRNQEDVTRLLALLSKVWDGFTPAEKAYWWGVVKGAYNADDLNRVGYAVNLLAGQLVQLPIDMAAYMAARYVAPDAIFAVPYDPADYADMMGKTTWTDADIPDVSDSDTYIGNVTLLRAAFDYQTDPLPTTLDKFGYTDANALEKALQGLYAKITDWQAEQETLIDNTAAACFYSGEIYAGEI